MNLKLFNTVEGNIVPENYSGKYWKKNRNRAAKFLARLPPYIQFFYFEDIRLCKLQLE